MVYDFDPVPADLTTGQERLILGSEACLWTERLNRTDWVEIMTFPRLCALAEVDWSPKPSRNWDQFVQRMETHRQRLEAADIAYFHDYP